MAKDKSIEWTPEQEKHLIREYEYTDDLDALCHLVGKSKLAVKSRIGDLRNDGVIPFKPMLNWRGRGYGVQQISTRVKMKENGIHIPVALCRHYGVKTGDEFEFKKTNGGIDLFNV